MTAARIAIVAAGPDIIGGQGIQAAALLRALRGEGIDASLVPIDPTFPRGLRFVRRLPCLRTALNEALYLPSLKRLRRADIVHVFSASYWSFLLGPAPAIAAARALGKRVILHYHSGEAERHLDRWGALVHPWLRQVHTIVVPSPYLRRIFERHGYRARVIRNIVDASRFRFRDRARLRPRLLSARNLEAYYRVEDTLRAFRIVRARHPGATLTIAGHGRQEARLRALAGSLGTEGIVFAGRIEPPAMPALFDAADIFVNASVVDNQPVSILEAFAAGLPVVSTPTGDIPAMVRDGEAGLLVPPGDPEAIAAASDLLLDDSAFAARVAARARGEVRSYSWPGVRDAWDAVYRGEAA